MHCITPFSPAVEIFSNCLYVLDQGADFSPNSLQLLFHDIQLHLVQKEGPWVAAQASGRRAGSETPPVVAVVGMHCIPVCISPWVGQGMSSAVFRSRKAIDRVPALPIGASTP